MIQTNEIGEDLMNAYFDNKVIIRAKGGTREMQKLAKSSIRWMLGYLVNSRVIDTVEIFVEFVDNLKEKEGTVADVIWTDDNIRPREFWLRVDSKKTPYTRMLGIAHECVHIKQYVTNEMFDYQKIGSYTRYRKKKYNYKKIAYRQLPWEVEAYAKEKPVLMAWATATENHHNIKQRRDR